MIKEIIDFAKDYHLEDRMIFLENYDINVARHLAWGADVWLNTPIRENEASGTSGMKAAINGVLNLSVLDGWWPEAYNGANGWAITAGEFYKHSELKERAEANQIYDLLEQEIAELYYERNELGIPEKWVTMMKASISSIFRFVNMNRVLIDYQDKFYLPSVRTMSGLSQNNYGSLRKAVDQQRRVLACWDRIRFTEFSTNAERKTYLTETDSLEVTCAVDLDQEPSDLFSIESFYALDEEQFILIPMQVKDRSGNIARYQGSFQIKGYGKQTFNARIRPADPIVQDLHPELIKWSQ